MKPQRRTRPRAGLRSPVPPPPRGPQGSANRFHILYIVISSLVVCSMIAVALTTIDFSSILGGDEDSANVADPNADLIAEQQTKVAQYPDDTNEIVLLANLLANTGRIHEAVPWYERALELAPDDHGIRLDFARSLAGAGLSSDAEAQFRRVLENDPDNQTAHYYLAQLYMSWEPARREQALKHYERAVDIDPESFLGERAKIELDAIGNTTPVASPSSSTPASLP